MASKETSIRIIRKFLDTVDHDPLGKGTDPNPDPSIIKNSKKTLISTVLWLFMTF